MVEIEKKPKPRKRARKRWSAFAEFTKATGLVLPETSGDQWDEVLPVFREWIFGPGIYCLYTFGAHTQGQYHIRPEDYACGCSPDLESRLPKCENRKPGCKFFVGEIKEGEISPPE